MASWLPSSSGCGDPAGAPETTTLKGPPVNPGALVVMRKEDTIRLHALLFQIRHAMEKKGQVTKGTFEKYDEFGVTPVNVHRDKRSHVHAIFLLGEAIGHNLLQEGSIKNTLHFLPPPKTRV